MGRKNGGTGSSGKNKWYAAGLAFECRQSGNCCSGEPGYVWVTKAEIKAIARFLGRKDEWLDKEHLRRVGFKYSLTERLDGDCIFLERRDGKTFCKINPVKPNQCGTWPFWDCNLKSPDHWNHAGLKCPGINHGPCHDIEHIERMRTRKPRR